MTEEQRIFSGKLFASEAPELVAKKNKDFGPNTTIVPPLHPMLAEERRGVVCQDSVERLCYARPTRDIPANSFAAGVPARVIRTITSGETVRHLFNDIR